MELFNLRPIHKKKPRKRVGRGGKRGTYSGRGLKGQKARAGRRPRIGFAGGDTPLVKRLPKKRGFRGLHPKPEIINLADLDKKFKPGDKITPQTLKEVGLVVKIKNGVKILGEGKLTKKLEFNGVLLSKTAKEAIEKVGGKISKKAE